MMEVQIILPERADDALSDGLRTLTSAIYAAMPELERGYGLGGPNGYGADFENDEFLMHHYCWCDSDECPWCGGCNCEQRYYADGREVSFTNERIDEVAHGEPCAYCAGVGPFATNGAEPSRGAPNFWHKPSGLKVWWYKYIGRGMKALGPSDADVGYIIAKCIQSLPRGGK